MYVLCVSRKSKGMKEKEKEKKAKKKNKRECELLRFYDNKGLIVTNIKMSKYPPERVENLIP